MVVCGGVVIHRWLLSLKGGHLWSSVWGVIVHVWGVIIHVWDMVIHEVIVVHVTRGKQGLSPGKEVIKIR